MGVLEVSTAMSGGQGMDMRRSSRHGWQGHDKGVVFPYPMGRNRGVNSRQSIRVLSVDTCNLVHVCLFPSPCPSWGSQAPI